MNNLKNQILLLLIVVSVFSCNFNVGNDYGNSKDTIDLPALESEVKDVIATTLNFFQTGNIEDWDAMLDINVKGLLYVSKAIIPKMITNNAGFIVNIGSIAGKDVYKNGNVYCASKFAVNALNKSMRLDLNEHNIRVAAIHPGLVETEFSDVRFKGDTERAKSVYQGFKALQADDIADIIHFVVTRPYHVNIEDLVVYPTAQASATMVHKNI